MTKVVVEGFGWVSIVLGLDGYTKKIVGYYAGMPCTARHWLAALDMAVNRQFPEGAREQAFTSDHNPKGNADTERVMRTRKEACLWLSEWTSPFALMRALESWIADDNEHYLHSALGYRSPRQLEHDYHLSHGTQFAAA